MKVRQAIAFVAICCFSFAATTVMGQDSNGTLQNNLFSQYTTQGASSATAGMYPAPHPVPDWVGSTYYTYQALMPHEMMYQHSRNYYNYYGSSDQFYGGYGSGGGLNKTTVRWQAGGANHMGPLPGNMFPLSNFYNRAALRRHSIPANRGVGSHIRGKASRIHGALHGLSPLGHLGGGCSSGDCGGESYYGESFGGDAYSGDIYNAAPAGGGCASGGCAVGAAPNAVLNR